MKKIVIMASLIIILIGQVSAQRGQFRGLYNANNEQEITGTIVKMEYQKMNPNARTEVLMLEVKTGEGIRKVMVGPEWYLNGKNIQMREKMKVKLIGSEAEINGEKMLLVREMVMENNKVQLRDRNGIPEWAGPKGVRGKGRMR